MKFESAESALKSAFGYDTFRDNQREIIDSVLRGQDTFVLMPTGGGKSMCYQIPALLKDGLTLVISPLISLMKDQVDQLKSNGIAAAFLNSSQSNKEGDEVFEKAKNGELKLLYLSPEKAIAIPSHIMEKLKVDVIAVDEAHCISSWGHDFRPEYKQLHQLRIAFPNATMMALTATADRLTQTDILSHLGLKNPATFVASFDRPNLELSVKYGMKKKEKINDILSIIKRYHADAGIIYCTAKKTTEALAGELQTLGVNAAFYHAGMSAEDRNRIQEDFIFDKIKVVCATIAFGMGIDKSNVRYVMHYNLPKSIENYYQEIGRAGRDGMKSYTRLYYSYADVILLRDFATQSGQKDINHEKLSRMQEYAEARICRRKLLLNYFGENLRDNCGNCDVCKNPPVHFDGSIVAQKALSALKRAELGGIAITIPLLIGTLRGSYAAEIKEKKLHELKTFGMGKEFSYGEWSYWLLQLQQIGAFEVLYEENNHLRSTPFSDMILRGHYKVDLVKEEKRMEEITEGADKKTKVHELTDSDTLYEQLKKYRKQLSDLESVPAYVIFNDNTLHQLIEQLPMTKEELENVSGFGERKIEAYGDGIIDIIIRHQKDHQRGDGVPSEIFQAESLRKYVEELKSKKMNYNATVISRYLLALDRFEEPPVTFYGLLKGQLNKKDVFDSIKPLVDEIKKSDGDENELRLKESVRSILSSAPDKIPDEKEMVFFQDLASQLPIKEGKEEQEAPRSGMPWSPNEVQLLKDLTAITNRTDVVAKILKRGEKSVLFAIISHLQNDKTI